MKKSNRALTALSLASLIATSGIPPTSVNASSHMDAPQITLDDAANTTDVYAFVTERDGTKYLSTALAVYPHQEPGIGPNIYRFDDNVLYEIHVAMGSDVADGGATFSYQFQFDTQFKDQDTIRQAFLDRIENVDDEGQNLTQTYSVVKVDKRGRRRVKTPLGSGIVPPNNQGNVTPFYNLDNNGENPAKGGVATVDELDRYTSQTVTPLADGYRAFAGQRDDGFYGDIQAIFDGLSLRTSADGTNPAEDSQGGFNVHTIALEIPVSELGGDQQIVGVYATTSRRRQTTLRFDPIREPRIRGRFLQVGRQGNPLFAEGLVSVKLKDIYNRTSPARDTQLFDVFAREPELAALFNLVLFRENPDVTVQEQNREDIVGIYIPDMIRTDLSTEAVPLAGGGENHSTNPDDENFSRLSLFGDDLVFSPLQNKMVPGGWPNGRRFGDDVVDIAVTAIIGNPDIVAGDNVDSNDIAYNKVFPYAATPLNGRNHEHP